MKKHNALTGKFEEPMIKAENGKAIVPISTVKASANWLRNRANKLKKAKNENKA